MPPGDQKVVAAVSWKIEKHIHRCYEETPAQQPAHQITYLSLLWFDLRWGQWGQKSGLACPNTFAPPLAFPVAINGPRGCEFVAVCHIFCTAQQYFVDCPALCAPCPLTTQHPHQSGLQSSSSILFGGMAHLLSRLRGNGEPIFRISPSD